jgi:hypothetical protein
VWIDVIVIAALLPNWPAGMVVTVCVPSALKGRMISGRRRGSGRRRFDE